MLEQYPVMTEKSGEYVAQFKATVVLQPSSLVVIAGGLPITDKIECGKEVKDEELKALMAQPLWKRDKKAMKDEKKEEKPVEKKKGK